MSRRTALLLLAGMWLIGTFAGCGSKPRPTLSGGKPPDYWVKNVTSPDTKLRKEAVAKLGNVGKADPDAAAALIGALHDKDAAIRSEAILALLKIGPDAKQATKDLDSLAQHDRDAKVRAYAAKALAKIQPGE